MVSTPRDAYADHDAGGEMPPKIELPPAPDGPDRPFILARVYPGYIENATELFQMDAENLAVRGYLPITVAYAEGHYPSWFIAVSCVLVFVAIGLVMLLFMAAVRPPGSLSVTYLRRESAPYLRT
jgi:hypothetical protein